MAADNHGLFWNSVNDDRTYDADSFSEWLRKFFTSGVFKDELVVTASGGMGVSVSTGYVNIQGKVRFFDSVSKFTIATADSTNPRIDTIVTECDYTNRTIDLKCIQGNYSGNNPRPKAPVRNTNVYQLVLAQIQVNAGATQITQANITDKRPDTNVCGYVTGTVDEMDFDQFTAQFDSYIEQYKKDKEEAFENWWERVKKNVENVAPIENAEIDKICV